MPGMHRATCSALTLALALSPACSRDERAPETAPVQGAEAHKVAPASPRTAAPDACGAICEHAVTLKCGTAERCVDECRQMLAAPGCEAPLAAFLRCAAEQPSMHWQCDAALQAPSLRDGFCDAQQGELAQCMTSKS